MGDRVVYLKSLHPYNFRHHEESPKIIGFVTYTPKNLDPRPCFKVEYESDGKIDYITYESVRLNEWRFAEYHKEETQ